MIGGQWGICDLDSCTDDAIDTTESFKVESTTLVPTTETESSMLEDNEENSLTD